jgi:Tfp pilus assembly protein PilF
VALLEAARASGDAGHEIDAYEKLGVIAWRTSQPEDAFGALGRALALAESLRDRRRQAHVLMSLGIQCVQMRRFLEARSFYERSRELARAEHLVRVVATLANNLGVVHHEEDRLEEARASFEEATEQGTRAGMALLVGVARGNLGMVDHESGRFLEARLALDTAVRLLASLGDTRFRAVFLGARAALHADDGAIELARADLAAAGALLERAFEPQLALALSIRSAHVELAEASMRGDAASRTRARVAAEAHLGESTVASSVAARSDLARMALRALARRRNGDGPP